MELLEREGYISGSIKNVVYYRVASIINNRQNARKLVAIVELFSEKMRLTFTEEVKVVKNMYVEGNRGTIPKKGLFEVIENDTKMVDVECGKYQLFIIQRGNEVAISLYSTAYLCILKSKLVQTIVIRAETM